MKKFLSIFLAVLMCLPLAFSFGCGGEGSSQLKTPVVTIIALQENIVKDFVLLIFNDYFSIFHKTCNK